MLELGGKAMRPLLHLVKRHTKLALHQLVDSDSLHTLGLGTA
jgi:hypothetical protein